MSGLFSYLNNLTFGKDPVIEKYTILSEEKQELNNKIFKFNSGDAMIVIGHPFTALSVVWQNNRLRKKIGELDIEINKFKDEHPDKKQQFEQIDKAINDKKNKKYMGGKKSIKTSKKQRKTAKKN
jgi:hypothetical protein